MFDSLPSIFGGFYELFVLLEVFGNFVYNFMFSTFSEGLNFLTEYFPLLTKTGFYDIINVFLNTLGLSNAYPLDVFFGPFVVIVALLFTARIVLDIVL